MKISSPVEVSEIHKLGQDTHYDMVRASTDDQRDWIQHAPVCPSLLNHRIVHVGVMRACRPFEVSRSYQTGSYFMATWAGRGEIMVDGEWVKMGAGQACILPARFPSAHRAADDSEPWSFSWVRYEERLESMPITSATRPIIRPYDAAAFTHAVEGLHLAVKQSDALSLQQHWVDLLHGYVMAFEEPSLADDRIRKAWLHVKDSLHEPWDAVSMAQLANVSAEHFRRLCRTHLGRSPVKHLTFLRLQEAVRLLQTSSDTIDGIAHAVGYQTAAALSKAIYKWTGYRPGALRKQGRVTTPGI